MEKQRVVVAMSGGVDSSVAAALLKDHGHEVIGITMCLSLPEIEETPRHIGLAGVRSCAKLRCCGREGIESARRVAGQLGIRHYVLDLSKLFKKYVVDDFCREYSLGRTPNPCVLCNEHIKFGALLKHALLLKAKYLATGHYASIGSRGGANYLKKAGDPQKDQSYFLYRLGQDQLKHILFPLAKYTKKQVRALASEFGLPVAERKDSQEICFVPGDYREFVSIHVKDIKPGDIVNAKGDRIGRHKGIAYYTIGQRQGLGIAGGIPLYITSIDARNNRISVGNKVEAGNRAFLVKKALFPGISFPKKKIAAKVKIRYNHKESPASISPCGKHFKVEFRKAQFAITPGQSAVFYQGQKVLGGGIIDRVIVK